MKKLRRYGVSTVLLLTLLFACEKQENELNNSNLQIQEARNWFEANYESLGFKNQISPVWNKAIVTSDVIELPFTTDGKLAAPRAGSLPLKFEGREKLQLAKDGAAYHIMFVRYIPSATNTAKISAINMDTWKKDFSGKIQYETPGVADVRQDYVINGVHLFSSSAAKRETTEGGRFKNCEWYAQTTNWYQYSGGEWNPIGSTTATWVECGIEYYYNDYGYDYESQWGGVGGGGASGYDGGTSTSDDCININLENPCLNSVAQYVLNPNLITTYNNLIQDIFNTNDQVNLTISQTTLPGDGGTLPASVIDGRVNVYVLLDPARISGGSNEYIAAVIYHECFHAIIKALSNNGYTGDEEHIQMFTNYLSLLADGLQAAYPGMLVGDAKGLILQGLINKDGGSNPIGDKWSTAFVDQVLSSSGFTRAQIDLIYKRYQVFKTSGTFCN